MMEVQIGRLHVRISRVLWIIGLLTHRDTKVGTLYSCHCVDMTKDTLYNLQQQTHIYTSIPVKTCGLSLLVDLLATLRQLHSYGASHLQ